jgi:hypothetical protein
MSRKAFIFLVENIGVEPMTFPTLSGRSIRIKKPGYIYPGFVPWRISESNR